MAFLYQRLIVLIVVWMVMIATPTFGVDHTRASSLKYSATKEQFQAARKEKVEELKSLVRDAKQRLADHDAGVKEMTTKEVKDAKKMIKYISIQLRNVYEQLKRERADRLEKEKLEQSPEELVEGERIEDEPEPELMLEQPEASVEELMLDQPEPSLEERVDLHSEL